MALNTIALIGRMTREPELRVTGTGTQVCGFSIAVDRPFRKDRERETDFIPVVTWQGAAEFVSRHFRKGDPIQVVGSLRMRRYQDKTGEERTVYEVVASDVGFVEGYKRQNEQENDTLEEMLDDDLPFGW